MVDVSGAAVLQAAVPNCQVALLDNCGHSVALERPRKAAKLITDFLSAQEVNGESAKKHSWRKLLIHMSTPDLTMDEESKEKEGCDEEYQYNGIRLFYNKV